MNDHSNAASPAPSQTLPCRLLGHILAEYLEKKEAESPLWRELGFSDNEVLSYIINGNNGHAQFVYTISPTLLMNLIN